MATLYRPDLQGEKAEIDFGSGHRIAASISWIRDWQVGLTFDQTIDVERLLMMLGAAAPHEDRRTEIRHEVQCTAKLRVNQRFYFGRISDISCAGARFLTPGKLKKSGAAVLMLPDLPPLATSIRWAESGEFGLQFVERMPLQALEKWISGRAISPAAKTRPPVLPQTRKNSSRVPGNRQSAGGRA